MEPQPSFIQRFIRDNPDLEKFVGENLINKVGIAILVLGIGYFVKFAIDQQWINEVGLFTVALAVFNFGVAQLLYRRPGIDRTLIYLLIGLVVTFGSLAIPVQLAGNFITMFWALETVLLLWLAQKSGLRLMATSSIIINKIGPVGVDGASGNSFWSSHWLIWVALGLGLAVLGLLSVRMMREMK